MPSIYTDSQILALQGMQISSFDQVATEECHHSSSGRDSSAYSHSCNMPSIMDKGPGQGEYAWLEYLQLGRIANTICVLSGGWMIYSQHSVFWS
jgi:hypothetical protein